MAARLYQRLRGTGRSLAGRASLWLGPDHLLSLSAMMASEEYRRFYYRDIEGFIIRRDDGRAVWNRGTALIFCLTALPMFYAWYAKSEVGWLIGASIIAATAGLIVLVNSLRGPTCVVHIRTAVQIERLPSLRRVPLAERALTRLAPLIAEAQGTIDVAQIAEADWGLTPPRAGAPAMAEPIAREVTPPPNRHEPGRLHAAVFALFVFDAACTCWGTLAASKPIMLLGILGGLAALLTLLVALRRQSRSDLPLTLQRLAWAGLYYYIASFFIGLVYTMIYTFRHDGQQPQGDPLIFINEPGFIPTIIAASVVGGAIGVIGLVSLALRPRTAAPA